MRTTVNIEDDIFHAVKNMAKAQSQPLGRVMSQLIRQGIRKTSTVAKKNGFPVFSVSERSKPLTLDDVKKDEDE